MKLLSDQFEFEFNDPNIITVFKFDECDKLKPTYHGVTALKAVDLIIELKDRYFYVEIKDYAGKDSEFLVVNNTNTSKNADNNKESSLTWLIDYLKYKYRDTFLYRYAENAKKKPTYYVCLLTFENPLNTFIQKKLRIALPVGILSSRWKYPLADNCLVMNIEKWNARFPNWYVKKL